MNEFLTKHGLNVGGDSFHTVKQIKNMLHELPDGYDFSVSAAWSFGANSMKSGYAVQLVILPNGPASEPCSVNLMASRGNSRVFKTFDALESFCIKELKVESVEVFFG